MKLMVQSDASSLFCSRGRSVIGGIQHLGRVTDPSFLNGAIYSTSVILDVVVASAA